MNGKNQVRATGAIMQIKFLLIPAMIFAFAGCSGNAETHGSADPDSLQNKNTALDTSAISSFPQHCFIDSIMEKTILTQENSAIVYLNEKVPLDGRLLAYKQYLDGLDKKDPGSVLEGAKTLATCFDGWPEATRDSAFLVYYSFYYPMVRGYTSECPPDEIMEKLSGNEVPASVAALIKKINPYGISMVRAEACYVSIELTGFLEKQVSSSASPSMQAYLAANTLSEKYFFHISSDAEDLKLCMQEIADAIAAFDAVETRYPGTIAARLSHYGYMSGLRLFLLGDNNLMPYETDAKQKQVLRKEARLAWEKFIKDNPNSSSGGIVRACYDLLKDNNFILDDKTEKAITKKFL
jgi:hypothetical protein